MGDYLLDGEEIAWLSRLARFGFAFRIGFCAIILFDSDLYLTNHVGIKLSPTLVYSHILYIKKTQSSLIIQLVNNNHPYLPLLHIE